MCQEKSISKSSTQERFGFTSLIQWHITWLMHATCHSCTIQKQIWHVFGFSIAPSIMRILKTNENCSAFHTTFLSAPHECNLPVEMLCSYFRPSHTLQSHSHSLTHKQIYCVLCTHMGRKGIKICHCLITMFCCRRRCFYSPYLFIYIYFLLYGKRGRCKKPFGVALV